MNKFLSKIVKIFFNFITKKIYLEIYIIKK